MHWAAIVFGWPAVIASIAVTTAGLIAKRAALVAAGATVALPFMSYLFASPRFTWIAIPIVVMHFGSAFAIQRGRTLLAWCGFLPFVIAAALVRAVTRGW